MLIGTCSVCRSEGRELAEQLCCDCWAKASHLQLDKLETASLETTALMPVQLEAMVIEDESTGWDVGVIYRLRMIAERGEFWLGRKLLPVEGVKIIQAGADFTQYHRPDPALDALQAALPPFLREGFLSPPLNYGVWFTVLEAAGDKESLENGIMPEGMGQVLKALGVPFEGVFDLAKNHRTE